MGNAGQGRLNFVIPDGVEQRLDLYCDRTGRSPTDVIRQLVSEWIEGDRELEQPAKEHPTGRRTNIPLSYGGLAALDEHVRKGGHASAAAVIAALLTKFLANRVDPKPDESIIVHVPIRVVDLQALKEKFKHGGKTLEGELAATACGWAAEQALLTATASAKGTAARSMKNQKR